MNCTICLHPTDGREPIRHDRCASRLAADLCDIPSHYALMGAVLAPGTVGGRAHVSGTRTAPLPVRLEPLSQRGPGGMVTTLAMWETHIRAERGLSAGTPRGISEGDLNAIVLFLRSQLAWATEQYSQVRKLASDLRNIIHECRAAAGILPNMTRIGDCPNPLGDNAPCGTALYADAYADQIQCKWCRRTWFRHQWVPLGKRMRGIGDEDQTEGQAEECAIREEVVV